MLKTTKTLKISGWTTPKTCSNCQRLDNFDNECMEHYDFADDTKRVFISRPRTHTCDLWTDDKEWERNDGVDR